MYEQTLQKIGLNKNEAIIYETLLREGVCTVGKIAQKSLIHRRNVYDSLNRLVDSGLAFEIIETNENTYQAADPEVLTDMLELQQQRLAKLMPGLEELYKETDRQQMVSIYRGPEGWKNYMNDMLREADEAYFIGAKGAWLDERVQHFFPHFDKEARRKEIKYHHLFDYQVKEQVPEILPYVGGDYRFLPPQYSAGSGFDVFADRVYILPDLTLGRLGDEIRLVVIVNEDIAEFFKTWFRFMWSICPKTI